MAEDEAELVDASKPKLRVPPGMMLVELPNGGWEVRATGETWDRVLSTRVSDAMYADLLPFVECFPTHRVSDALRWLLAHPDVRKVQTDFIRDSTKRAVDKAAQNGKR